MSFYSLRNIKNIVSKCLYILPDSLMLRILFALKLHRWLNLKNPQTFNEKLQWLKLHNRKNIYTTMVDKYSVKDYVEKIIGKEFIIPTIGIWNHPEEINFTQLPDKFVLKTTHGGGGKSVIICKDKKTFNKTKAINTLKEAMKEDIYVSHREWPYKNVQKRIIAEQFIDNGNEALSDYKFFCFNGKPKMMLVSNNRFHGETEFDYFDMNFTHLPFTQGGRNSNKTIIKPTHFNEMKEIAEKLAKGIPHIRVDLYEVNDKILFGELTFFDSSGLSKFKPAIWDYKIGQLLDISNIN